MILHFAFIATAEAFLDWQWNFCTGAFCASFSIDHSFPAFSLLCHQRALRGFALFLKKDKWYGTTGSYIYNISWFFKEDSSVRAHISSSMMSPYSGILINVQLWNTNDFCLFSPGKLSFTVWRSVILLGDFQPPCPRGWQLSFKLCWALNTHHNS